MRQTAPLQPEAPKSRKRKAQSGYGMVLLMLFLMSSVLLAAAMPMMYGPGMVKALGSSAQDSLSAKQAAASGLETVLADMQSKINAGTTVDATYTYPSTPINMPQDPTALGGATVQVGSYSAAMTTARGSAYLLKVTATVGVATAFASKLVTMSRNTYYTLDNMVAPTVAYSLRKLRSAYAGYAVNVRRASDNTTQDIGFDGQGNLDMDSLKSFLSQNTLPADSVSSPTVAFGLRRLRNGYTGAVCMNVRRSSDNTTLDIGFTPSGDLDITALLNFVGTGTGYVATWYDQSGNGTNATQGTTTLQPTIVVGGIVNMINNRPAIKYDGVDDYLAFNRTISNDFTIATSFSTITGNGSNPAGWGNAAAILSTANAADYDFGITVDSTGNIYAGMGGPADVTVSVSNPGYNDSRMHWAALTRTKSTGYVGLDVDNNSTKGPYDATLNTNSQTGSATMAICANPDGNNTSGGYVNEVLIYNSVLSQTNLNLLKRNATWYFNQGSVTAVNPDYPLNTVNTNSAVLPAAAYGLRKLKSSYGGNLIKVRRSSDNTTQDIGYDAKNELDVASLMTFVGAGNSGYIDTWYDQSGNGRNAAQATTGKQPRIVNAGVLETQNGKPTIRFVSANVTDLLLTTEVTGITDYTAFGMGARTGSVADHYFMAGTSVNRQILRWNGSLAYYGGSTTVSVAVPNTTTFNLYEINRASGLATGYYNGSAYVYGSNDSGSMTFGQIGGLQGNNAPADGYMSEIILYGSSLGTTDRQTIEKSMLAYYSPPIASAYVTKWYDQSGNGNDATQTNPMQQPTITMPLYGTFNNRPTINFNGNQFLVSSTGMPTSADYTKVAVTSFISGGSNYNVISSGSASTHAWFQAGTTMWSNGTSFAGSTKGWSTSTLMALATTYVESSKTGTLYRLNIANGTGTATVSNTNADFNIGAFQKSANLIGTIPEAIIFGRVLNATDRTTIYNDEVGYYGAQ